MTPGSRRSLTCLLLLSALAASSLAQASEKDARRFDPEIARRYQEILERDPGQESVLKHLLELYGRGPGVGTLISSFEARVRAKKSAPLNVWLILGHLYRAAGRFDESKAAYQAAQKMAPESPLPLVSAAKLARAQRDSLGARQLYTQALQKSAKRELREELLTTLAGLALDANDLEAARGHLETWKRERATDRFVAVKVARLYAQHGALEDALREWRALQRRAGTHTAEVVAALKEIGELCVRLGRDTEAEKAYRKALGLVARGNWHIGEIRERLVEIYRRRDALRTLVSQWESRWKRRGFDEWSLLARLYDETGQEKLAIRAHRQAVKANPRNTGARFALIQVFERLGKMGQVVTEYERLIRDFPRQPRFRLDLADLHYRRQQPAKALKLLDKLAKRNADPSVLATLADAFTRYGENGRALRIYRRLVRLAPRDETHLISLGEQLFLMGKVDEARKTWRRILKVVPQKATGWRLFAETLAEHDLLEEAVDAFRKAVERAPDDLGLLRALALALDRHGDRKEAVKLWERIHARAQEPRLRRQARQWIVRLYESLKLLPGRVLVYQKAFRAKPTELETGRLLAESLLRLRRQAQAEKVLLSVLEAAPSDLDSLEALEELYLDQNKLKRAIEVLTRIAELNPYRAKEFYQRVAEFSLRLYQDEDAVRFAGLAVDLNPDDSQARSRLADIYYRMQNLSAAAREYKKAVELDGLNFQAHFRLARVLRDLGRLVEADQTLRLIVRRAPEDTQVLRAARKAIHLNLMTGKLESLERELVPYLWRNPVRPVFRRIVTELYGHLVWPLLNRARFAPGDESDQAIKDLRALGSRAVKPLLEALTDEDAGLRMATLAVLADLGHASAAIPIGRLMDQRDVLVRMRTAVALGRIAAPAGIAALRRGLSDGDRGVRMASAWALGKIKGARAEKALLEFFNRGADPQWGVRAIAAAALGHGRSPAAVSILLSLISGPGADSKEEVRAAACWALSARSSPRARAALLKSLRQDTLLARRGAALALTNSDHPDATKALLQALWTGEPTLRATALRALAGAARQPPSQRPIAAPPFINLQDGQATPDEYVTELLRLDQFGAFSRTQAGALLAHPRAVRDAILEGLSSDDDEAVLLTLSDLDGDIEQLTLGPFTHSSTTTPAPAPWIESLKSPALLERLEQLSRHSLSRLRARAVSVLGKLASNDSGLTAFAAALEDEDSRVRRSAVTALARRRGPKVISLLGSASQDSSWITRAEVARALGLLGEGTPLDPLSKLLNDRFATVRAAAATALAQRGAKDAVSPLISALQDTSGPVRSAAAQALGKLGAQGAVSALEGLRSDEEVRVRDAAEEALQHLRP